MKAALRILAFAVGVFTLAACGPDLDEGPLDVADSEQVVTGTRITVKFQDKEYFVTLKGRDGLTFFSEATNWKHEYLYRNQYYRGLLLIGREEDGYEWELDADLSPLDAMFPLSIGKAAELSGNVINKTKGDPVPYEATLEVVAENTYELPSGSQTVYEVRVEQRYLKKNEIKKWSYTVSYAPNLSINLKGVFTEDGEEQFWSVTEIQRPDSTKPIVPARQRRRSGTVMI